MISTIQIELDEVLQTVLQKEALKKDISVSQLISELLKKHLLNKSNKIKQAKAMKLLRELAETAPKTTMSDDEMMDLINSEIKAMRAEKQSH